MKITSSGDDFALEYNGKAYLFLHELPIAGDVNVVFRNASDRPRAFTGVQKKISSVKWLDCNEELDFCQDVTNGLFTLKPTMYPYGTDIVVRIAQATF